MALFRPATLQERKIFYETEFSTCALRRWPAMPQLFCIDPGTETGIAIDPALLNQLMVFEPDISWERLAQKLRHYLPEDVYYDTTRFPDARKARRCPKHRPVCDKASCGNWGGRTLVFDIDSENIDCPQCGNGRGRFCSACLHRAFENADLLATALEHDRGFRRFGFVYSGRGVHVHVLDEEAHAMSPKERSALASSLLRFAIDPWVTSSKRWIRLPYTLHGLISRIAMPLAREELRSFDPTDDPRVIPRFLR